MLKVKTQFEIKNFEDGLANIYDGKKLLQLPNKVKANAVGGVVSLIQLIITWSRNTDSATLRLHADNLNDKTMFNFSNTPFGVTALNMAKNIQNRSGEPVSRREALMQARDYVMFMHDGKLEDLRNIKKDMIPILCLDNSVHLQHPGRLYNKTTGNVRERYEFEDLVSASYSTILMTREKMAKREFIEPIASLLYEAFQNTHEHAQNDVQGNRYSRSTRGVIFGYHSIPVSSLPSMAGEDNQLRMYFKWWQSRCEQARHAQFAEVSIFDSGPGLAKKWLSKNRKILAEIESGSFSIEDEYHAVIECLQKGGTTKKSISRGNGLFRIMQVVKRSGGYIRIRSGRLSLVKAFTDNLDVSLSKQDIEMVDANDGRIPTSARAWAEGTVITAMIPLNRVGL
jgi:hypothetical protein